MYRRNNQRHRRYGYQNQGHQNAAVSNQLADIPDIGAIKRLEDIPLPNESESPEEFASIFRGAGISGIIDFFRARIGIEEIILIGLIIILIGEGINCIEDEFLLVMLIYILLT